MTKINNVAVIGMGALGLLFGERMFKNGRGDFYFLMDEERKARHLKDRYTINGDEVSFPIRSINDVEETPDLIIIATKYPDLGDAGKLAKEVSQLSKDGRIPIYISLLNGITSEEILSEELPRSRIIDSVAIGMDAQREGTDLSYANMGRIQIGPLTEEQEPLVDSLVEYFEFTDTPYELRHDIKKAMWNKYMINVGINQACMVYEMTYGEVFANEESNLDMVQAMREVMAVAACEGIEITEADFDADIKILKGLNPDGYPSMQQDAMAKRKSEVELFAGTLIKIARKHGVQVPVNEKFYNIIKEKESRY